MPLSFYTPDRSYRDYQRFHAAEQKASEAQLNAERMEAKVQRLLDGTALRCEHFCQDFEAQSLEQGNETTERVQIETAMFDIEHGGCVADFGGDFASFLAVLPDVSFVSEVAFGASVPVFSVVGLG